MLSSFKKKISLLFVLFSLRIKSKIQILSPPSCSMDSGSSESPASLKRVASPAAKPAVSGEGENLSEIKIFRRWRRLCNTNSEH